MLNPSQETKEKHILSRRLYFLTILIIVALTAHAQNNPYKIDDALYPIYRRATQLSRQPEGLSVADSLYRKAVELDDKKAQCLAYTIPLQYYSAQEDDEKIEEAAAKLREISRTNDYLQYYYYA